MKKESSGDKANEGSTQNGGANSTADASGKDVSSSKASGDSTNEKNASPEKQPSAPPSGSGRGSVEPIRAMRVIRLEDSKAPTPAGENRRSAPAIEARESSYDEIKAGLDDDELNALKRETSVFPPRPDSSSPPSVETKSGLKAPKAVSISPPRPESSAPLEKKLGARTSKAPSVSPPRPDSVHPPADEKKQELKPPKAPSVSPPRPDSVHPPADEKKQELKPPKASSVSPPRADSSHPNDEETKSQPSDAPSESPPQQGSSSPPSAEEKNSSKASPSFGGEVGSSDELSGQESSESREVDQAEPLDVDEPAPESVEPEEVESVEELSQESQAVKRKFAPDPPMAPEVPPADRKPPPLRRSAKPSLPQAKKSRKKPWWETLFGDDFSRAYRPMSEAQLGREVDFIVESLALPKGAVILDLGCGQGEICVELSKRGYSVVGYDLSVYQLAMAGDNAQAARQKINFLQGDMREMAFEQMFDGVLSWDTSFGYFEEEKNQDVLERVKSALKPGGRFLLDVMNRDFAAREAPYNHWFEGDGCVCMDDMVMDWITNRLKVKRSIILDDGRSKELQYSVRLYGLSDVGRMLHDVGFRVSAVSGDVCTKGAFFGPHSRRIIIQSGKP